MQILLKSLAVILIVGAFAVAGTMSYQDAKMEQARYCDMVEDGHWPAYKPEVMCGKEAGQ